MCNAAGGNVYINLTLARRPLRRGVDGVLLASPIPILLASNADGFHSSSNDKGPTIVDSTISFTGAPLPLHEIPARLQL